MAAVLVVAVVTLAQDRAFVQPMPIERRWCRSCAFEHLRSVDLLYFCRSAVRLLRSQSVDGIYRGCAARGQIAGEVSRGDHPDGDHDVGHRIDRAHVKEDGGHQPHRDESDNEATPNADAGEHDNVRVEGIDAANHLAYEIWLGELVVMNVADLRDAQAVECFRQTAQKYGPLDELEMMPIPESAVGHKAASPGQSRSLKKLPSGDRAAGSGAGGSSGHSCSG